MSELEVTFIKGSYRGNDLAGQSFALADDYRETAKGSHVTVYNNGRFPGCPEKIRVKVDTRDDVSFDGELAPKKVEETDDEVIQRIRKRFNMLNEMTKAVKRGEIRSMIVKGPPGVGKSHGVEHVLQKYETLHAFGVPRKHEIVKGAMTPLGLYCQLHKYSDKDNVLVFDDCDSVFNEELSLNILKAALDSKKTRRVHWNADSYKLKSEGVPDQYEFSGSGIFITNLNFDKVRGKLREHLAALESRSHVMDLTINTEREKFLRIKQVVQDGGLEDYRMNDDLVNEILDYINTNKKRLIELSVRTVLKVADLAKAFPNDWEEFAENTVIKT